MPYVLAVLFNVVKGVSCNALVILYFVMKESRILSNLIELYFIALTLSVFLCTGLEIDLISQVVQSSQLSV